MSPPTLGEILASGDEVSVTCGNHRCRHHEKLDLVALSDKYGAGAILYDLRLRMRCGKCGHRGAELSRAPVNAKGYARSHV